MPGVVVLDNPVLQDILVRLRDRRTRYPEFRRLLYRAGVHVGYELARLAPVEEAVVETPLGAEAQGLRLRSGDVAVVAVLRAALPYAWGMLEVLEEARLGLIAARRLENGRRPGVEVSYTGLPGRAGLVVLADPMLATGVTLEASVRLLRERGLYGRLAVATVIATPEGVARVLRAEPEATVYALAVDEELDDRAYIVPGLGDAGDRAFGT